jgi:15-cis-phytoene synthase
VTEAQQPDAVVAESRAVLATHARSFRWASLFLPRKQRDAAAIVYAVCRAIDDAADEAESVEQAHSQLAELRAELEGDSAVTPLGQALRATAQERGMSLVPLQQLMDGVCGDLENVEVADDAELMRYCYRVAGTVGLLMCAVLGVREREAFRHAVDLGIAMQLTNICRDVAEDAAMGRVYLPRERLLRQAATSEQLVAREVATKPIRVVVGDLLELAERYYRSAEVGMRFIPWRSRLAIVVASRIYRAIGRKLLRRYHANPLHGRTVVGPFEKLLRLGGAVFGFVLLSLFRKPYRPHCAELHTHIESLIAKALPDLEGDVPRHGKKEEFDELSNKDGLRVDRYSKEHLGRLGASLRGT